MVYITIALFLHWKKRI